MYGEMAVSRCAPGAGPTAAPRARSSSESEVSVYDEGGSKRTPSMSSTSSPLCKHIPPSVAASTWSQFVDMATRLALVSSVKCCDTLHGDKASYVIRLPQQALWEVRSTVTTRLQPLRQGPSLAHTRPLGLPNRCHVTAAQPPPRPRCPRRPDPAARRAPRGRP